MNRYDVFTREDLNMLDDLLLRAEVVAMEDIRAGNGRPDTIGLRHDCDNVILPAVEFARWEAERGYRSTYYILHTAPYWKDKTLLQESLYKIAECGHEIGIHNDAITAQLETGQAAAEVLHEALAELRGYGHTVKSTAAHGHRRCGTDRYVNDEMFKECRRQVYGGDIGRLGVKTTSLASFGLEFDASWMPRGDYISDSGGVWSQPFHDLARTWPDKGQLHMLAHPDWWGAAFQKVAA